MIDDIAFKYESNWSNPYTHYLVCYRLCLCLLLLSNFKVVKQYKLLISQLHMLQTVTCVTSLS